jgi:recombination protein RecT
MTQKLSTLPPAEIKKSAIALFSQPDVIKDFEPILKGDTESFIKSAVLAILNKPEILDCSPHSITHAALRSVTLRLSLDPALRQAFLIPRNTKIKARPGVPEHYEMTCFFQPHYHGLFDLAVRTRMYRAINVNPVYPNERVFQHTHTGLHYFIQDGTDMLAAPNPDITGLKSGMYRDVTDGSTDSKPIGYLAFFQTLDGFKKTVYMTVKEIHTHAQKYAPEAYNNQYGMWKNPKHLQVMEMKTVFLQLTKHMDLSGDKMSYLRGAIQESDEIGEIVDGNFTDDDQAPDNLSIQAQNMAGEESQLPPEEDVKNPTTTVPTQKAEDEYHFPLSQKYALRAMEVWGVEQQPAISRIVNARLGSRITVKEFEKFLKDSMETTASDENIEIKPLDKEWVDFAAKQWGISKIQASIQIEKSDKFPESMPLSDFKRIVNGR